MDAAPQNAAIDDFASLSNLPRSDAIRWLKAYNNDLNSAANAFFENPDALVSQSAPNAWDEEHFHSDKTDYTQQGQHQPSFAIHPPDSLNPNIFTDGAPARPPSRVSTRGTETSADNGSGLNKKLSLAEQEEQQMQQAMAMSMSQTLPDQEAGVVDVSNQHFGPANQEHYDTRNWTMTYPGAQAQEILLNPEPVHRRRQLGTPAFMKPSTTDYYLPAFITILHAIPVAREALLARENTIAEYGHDNEWWDGTPIRVPKIIDIDQDHSEFERQELVYEAQRLMAFLDQTERAYGSIMGLTRLYDLDNPSDQAVSTFLNQWTDLQADPVNELARTFKSVGTKIDHGEVYLPTRQYFYQMELTIDQSAADCGQTLYEAVDDILWREQDESSLEDIFLESIGDVFNFHVTRQDQTGSGLGIEIPAIWYADRYLESSKQLAKTMRVDKAKVKKEIEKIDQAQIKLSEFTNSESGKAIASSKLTKIAGAYFEKPLSTRVIVNGVNGNEDANSMESAPRSTKYSHVADELKTLADRVAQKLKALEESKQKAHEKLKELSKLYTKPSTNSEEAPHVKYTLRGVSTDPHTTYVLVKSESGKDDLLSFDLEEWQWWRISYTGNEIDPISHTKISEAEVLEAAKDESRTALLVYASERAISYETRDLPPQLKNFVRADNLAFAEELDKSAPTKQTTPTKRKADDEDVEDFVWHMPTPSHTQDTEHLVPITSDPTLPAYSPSSPSPPLSESKVSESYYRGNRGDAFHDGKNGVSLEETGPMNNSVSMAFSGDANEGGQEMQERSGRPGLVPREDARKDKDDYRLGSYIPEITMDDREDHDGVGSTHIEYVDKWR